MKPRIQKKFSALTCVLLIAVYLSCCSAQTSEGAGAAASVSMPVYEPPAPAVQLYVGWASADITPEDKVAIWGQKHLRISKRVNDPLTCTALAISTEHEQAVMVSCDLLAITKQLQDKVRDKVKGKLTGLDVRKIFLNATHTHTAPHLAKSNWYEIPAKGIMQPAEYVAFAAERIAQTVTKAWQNRKPAAFEWAISQAVIGHNRRAHYLDGTTVMYGNTSKDNFKSVEGFVDHAVEMLFFFTKNKKLTGILINVPCPSQETEGADFISADFWHETRKLIRAEYGKSLFIFPQCGAAGDISPHHIYRKKAEQEMLRRKGYKNRRPEIAQRIKRAVDRIWPCVQNPQSKVIFDHTVDNIKLPAKDPSAVFEMELHALRLGDIAICTNPFELYIDYGVRIKARTWTKMTIVSQLTAGKAGYLPTKKAVAGGGYSAEVYTVGPEGGAELANETIWRINEMWGD